MLILTGLIALIQSVNQLFSTIINSIPPDQRAQAYADHIARTKWMNDLLIKFSDKLDALITKDLS